MKMRSKVIICIFVVTLIFSFFSTNVLAASNYTKSFAILKEGNKGSLVSELQQALKIRGFYVGSIDGSYGPLTKKAVVGFQKSYGLVVDGIAGPQTQSALYSTSSILKLGSRGRAVSILQSTLNSKGYSAGAVDGIFGHKTKVAVMNYQRNNGLTVDGIAGPQTQSSLYGFSANRGTSLNSKYTSEDLYWLSRIIHAEAKGEPYEGKVAVGNVIINRVNSKDFPNTIKGVIFEYFRGIPQFSPVEDGSIYNNPSADSIQAAKDAMNNVRPVANCTYFFNPDKATGTWIVKNKTYHTRIGDHVFYK